jgi:TatD DNase family protein
VIDSHTHLQMVPGDDETVVAAAVDEGVTKIVTVAMDREGRRLALEQAATFDGTVYAALGRHPNGSTGFDDADAQDIADLARDPRCVAIGETGLDYHWDKASREDQFAAFHAQIEIARDTGKPLVIHTREAGRDTIDVLTSKAQDCTVILHCFSMPEHLDEVLEQDWWCSFAGNVTYPRNTDLADAATKIPLERILVETDAPFLTPQPVRKHRNQPAFVVHTARFLAERRGLAYEELDEVLHANAARLFGW